MTTVLTLSSSSGNYDGYYVLIVYIYQMLGSGTTTTITFSRHVYYQAIQGYHGIDYARRL